MIARLYLLRHGIAVPHGAPDVAEDDRPLTPKGEARVRDVAAGLRAVGARPGLIVTSPLPRARRTAELAAGVLAPEGGVRDDDVLRPGRGAPAVRDWLLGRDDESLMVVGHNPDLTALLGLLIGLPGPHTPFEMKKGGVAELRADPDADGAFRLQWFATPKLLRRVHRRD